VPAVLEAHPAAHAHERHPRPGHDVLPRRRGRQHNLVAPSNQGPTDPDEWEQVPPHPHRHQRDRTHPGSLTRQPRHDSRMRPQIQETAEAQPRFAWPATYRHASSVAGGLTTVEVAVPDAPTNLPGHTCQMPRTMAAGAACGGHRDLPGGSQQTLPTHGHLITQRAGGEQPDTPPRTIDSRHLPALPGRYPTSICPRVRRHPTPVGAAQSTRSVSPRCCRSAVLGPCSD
jgi:hypothetical protein